MKDPISFIQGNAEKIQKKIRKYLRYSISGMEDFMQEAYVIATIAESAEEFWERLGKILNGSVDRACVYDIDALPQRELISLTNATPEEIIIQLEDMEQEEREKRNTIIVFCAILVKISEILSVMTETQREIWEYWLEFSNISDNTPESTTGMMHFLQFLKQKGVEKSRTAVYNLFSRSLNNIIPFNIKTKTEHDMEVEMGEKRMSG